MRLVQPKTIAQEDQLTRLLDVVKPDAAQRLRVIFYRINTSQPSSLVAAQTARRAHKPTLDDIELLVRFAVNHEEGNGLREETQVQEI